MRKIMLAGTIAVGLGIFLVGAVLTGEEGITQSANENPQIDYQGFLKQVQEVAKVREKRRVSEEEFIRMMNDPKTIVLDARSKRMYDLLHVKGAVHISLPDMTAEDLAELIPQKDTRVVIYCNNNFKNEPQAFAPKAPVASLNLNTYNTLYSYGYRNIYELKPLLDRRETKIPFAGTSAENSK
ncbi:sulfurtransferase [Blastopirellula marina]|uniref:Sulfurtransferase n=1 Tax=Blastopirellula marina TaxID=124 RepID=A0A2S8FU49_9BACT|nr:MULTISPECIES: rhodanese-like domain-containing protein [Pirellulaceae]PQO35702.1 sulfurtransferase [Blastopirellula marina]RCS53276.1 rhodanese-like domain-containing protein [Bremerella cremea]